MTLTTRLLDEGAAQLLGGDLSITVRRTTMDVVATKALVKDHDGHVGDRAEISEFLGLKRAHTTTSFLEDVAAKVLDGSNGIHYKSRYEEENDPAFL